MDPAEQSQPEFRPDADAQRGVSWTLIHADAEAHGWVDTEGGVGRIQFTRGGFARDKRPLLDELDLRYPGVRWLSDAG